MSEKDLIKYIYEKIKLNRQFCDGDATLMENKITNFIKESKQKFKNEVDDLIQKLGEQKRSR